MKPRRLAGAVARRIPRGPFRFLLPTWPLRGLFRFWLSVLAANPNRRKAVRELLVAQDDVYRALDRAAIAYDEGVHVKHRLTRYHDFFVERVRPGERVLDIGSGKGEMAHDLVVRAGATVVGIDNDPAHLAFARSRFADDRLQFVEGDAVASLPDGHFDVVVLSNVLEHVDRRVELLRRIVESATPRCVLFRVPVLARDWTIPLRQEVGVTYFSDPGHFVEYDPDGFRRELAEAGLAVTELILVWGEIWAAAEPAAG
jgi:SAM-dependent methyltransferase